MVIYFDKFLLGAEIVFFVSFASPTLLCAPQCFDLDISCIGNPISRLWGSLIRRRKSNIVSDFFTLYAVDGIT